MGKTVDKEKAEEIATAWMQFFYGEQVGTIESQELKTKPIPHWLFRLTVDDPVERTYFVVLLPNGMVVEPSGEAVVAVLNGAGRYLVSDSFKLPFAALNSGLPRQCCCTQGGATTRHRAGWRPILPAA